MIIVILVVCILAVVLGAIVEVEVDDSLGFAISLFAWIMFVIASIVCIVLGVKVSTLSTVETRIEMYQEENAKIEQQIANVVAQYQQHETEIFTTVAPESSIALVTLYPELKADTLVQKQIEVYVENNEKIKNLKEEQINGSVLKWWLYFGGEKNGR